MLIMKKRLSPQDLQIGMYIELPRPWLKHPFVKNEFKITSQEQIQECIDSNLNEVVINMEKSDLPDQEKPSQPVPEKEEKKDQKKEESDQDQDSLLPDDFEENVNSNNIDPRDQARIVYSSSLNIMQNLLKNPTAENIKEFKEGASQVVNMILSNDATASFLLNITDYDFNTYTHSVNVGIYSILLAKALFGNTTMHNMGELGAGFFLHDIGKVRINPDILNKKGQLSEHEFNKVKTHTTQGHNILSETNQLSEESKIIVLQHHERHDGSGYPRGLSGNRIHLYSKICCIADVYDALISKRPYKEPMTPFAALKLMKKEMLDHFEKDIFREFVLLFQ